MRAERTIDEFRELLKYDLETGVFTWLVRQARCIRVGDVAGSVEKNGYRRITIGKDRYLAHRLAWLFVFGYWPASDLDHRDNNRDHNWLWNLRPTTVSGNAANKKRPSSNKSGFKGVCQVGASTWQAGIKVGGKSIHLGWHDTPEAAHEAYLKAAREHFGEFARAA